MKFTTLRNLMASMLVVGVAGSVIAVGNGTFALFNATTTNTGNTFTTDDLILTENNGSNCTAQASSNSGAASCSYLVKLSNMIPGDAKIGTFYIKNGSSAAAFTLGLTVSDSGTSLSATAPNTAAGSGGGGLGMFLFACRDSSSKPVDCSTASLDHLVPVYTTNGTSCTTTVGSALGALTSGTAPTLITVSGTSESITIGSSTCKPGNDTTALNGATTTVSGPDGTYRLSSNVFLPYTSVSGTTTGIDYFAMIVNLAGTAGDTFATTSDTSLSLAWKATQVVGAAQ